MGSDGSERESAGRILLCSEYTREDINRALRSEDPYSVVPSRDENGHGGAMAGVAGSRLGNGMNYTGAAPDADIVVVKLKEAKQYFRDFYIIPPGVPAYEETDIMLGVQYADHFAEQFQRPMVICLGLGTNYGDHAGSVLLPSYLDAIASKRSRAVVVCGGNEGNGGIISRGVCPLPARPAVPTAFRWKSGWRTMQKDSSWSCGEMCRIIHHICAFAWR